MWAIVAAALFGVIGWALYVLELRKRRHASPPPTTILYTSTDSEIVPSTRKAKKTENEGTSEGLSNNKKDSTAKRAFDTVQTLLDAPAEAWTVLEERQGVTLSRTHFDPETLRIVENGGYAVQKGETRISKSARDVSEWLMLPNTKQQYDNMVDTVTEVKTLPPHDRVMHARYKAPMFVTPRDFCAFFGRRLIGQDIVHASISVESPRCPVDSKYVRGRVLVSGHRMRPLSDSECLLTYVICVDLCGSIPSSLKARVAKEQPLQVAKIRELVQSQSMPAHTPLDSIDSSPAQNAAAEVQESPRKKQSKQKENVDLRVLGAVAAGELLRQTHVAARSEWLPKPMIKQHVALYRKPRVEADTIAFMGRGVVNAPPQKVLEFLRDNGGMFLEHSRSIHKVDEETCVLQCSFKARQWLSLVQRDAVLVQRCRDNLIAYVSTHVDAAPPSRHCIRAQVHPSGWVIEAHPQRPRLSAVVTCVLHAELNGALPAAMHARLADVIPNTIQRLRHKLN
ncbi:MAG: hypothetical protein MHM6MM_002371 [Cercozoa sp. M6MM]